MQSQKIKLIKKYVERNYPRFFKSRNYEFKGEKIQNKVLRM